MTADLPVHPAAPTSRRSRRPARQAWRRPAIEAAAVVAVFSAAGAAAGWLWLELWDAPLGVVQDGAWVFTSLPETEAVFNATALYVVIGALAGLLLGVVAAHTCRAAELVTLLAVAAGSALAGYLAYRVGLSLSPPDPKTLAPGLADGAELTGNIQVSGRSLFVAWPVGALIGLTTTYFITGSAGAGIDAARPFDDPRRTTYDD